jgi:mono/diheme cytochrome c family protein
MSYLSLRIRSGLAAPTALALLTVVSLGGCVVDREPNVEFLPWLGQMRNSARVESYDPNPLFKDGRALQVPPVGTIPRGFQPDHSLPSDVTRVFLGDEVNPEPPTPENIARGQWGFQTFCSPCHGVQGMGDGPSARFGIPGFPIGIKETNAGKMPPRQIFRLITHGRGVMPTYKTQIRQADRWRIILYLRTQLQKQAAQPLPGEITPTVDLPPAAGKNAPPASGKK